MNIDCDPQGQVLNQTSMWWMANTSHIIPNALLAVPDPNVAIMKRCTVFPVEFVVRGFMTGVAWCCFCIISTLSTYCLFAMTAPCSHQHAHIIPS